MPPPLSSRLELVTQGELHHARLCQQSGVVAELGWDLLQRSDTGACLRSQSRERIEPVQVRHIEYFPPELHTLSLPRHSPPLVQCHVQAGETISSNHIARAGLARIRVHKGTKGRGGIHKRAHGTRDGIAVMSHLWLADHLRDALFVPVRGPEVAVIHGERES